jgi:pimeloyl-ACP methyl ester carboxylesterase
MAGYRWCAAGTTRYCRLPTNRRSWATSTVADLRAYLLGFDFDPATITQPVRWWHGRHDVNVPIGIARRLVTRIPTASLDEYDGGHYAPPTVLAAAFEHARG